MRRIKRTICALMTVGLAACSESVGGDRVAPGAPGAPGAAPTWSNAQKSGIGTSYEAYDADGQFSEQSPTAPISKVWFSLAEDRITEVMWGLIHEAQIRELRYIVVGPQGAIAPETSRATPIVRVVGGVGHPMPLHSQVMTFDDGAIVLRAEAFTDPDRQTLVSTVQMESERDDVRVFAYIDPALGNSGSGDRAWVEGDHLYAEGDGATLMVASPGGFGSVRTVGFVGGSEALDDPLTHEMFDSTGEVGGNVEMLVEVPFSPGRSKVGALFIGFGEDAAAAKAEAEASLARGAEEISEHYLSGWEAYLASLSELPRLRARAEDGGALASMSAINLKIMEDKTHAGALIASLSNPWGETAPAVQPQTGYKAVWPRDFFQVASAFLAMGDPDTARAAYRYLPSVQVTEKTPGNFGVTGWFLQKTQVDGEIEWVAIQQDQTAMPIMLGWQLWQAGVISDEEIADSYAAMLKPAADFLVDGGRPGILWNSEFEASLGYTQQERWEEQEGYSPSTIAAVISGLVVAADLAMRFGESSDAVRYLEAADKLEASLENWMFTTNGALGDGEYFIRITRNQDPNDAALLGDNNGRPGLPENQIIDGGFLELVRYGVRAWDSESVLDTLEELDGEHEDNLRVRYTFDDGRLGWRRYGNDGYGEDGEAGTNYHEIDGGNTPGQRGRVWPFFSGERGHYEMARLEGLLVRFEPDHPIVLEAESRIENLVKSMEVFANAGLALPEQVWDSVGPNPFGYRFGGGTNSATPLAWTHAEYIKLLRSVADGAVWDRYEIVKTRYADRAANRGLD
ncbi:MAG: glycoside hydrolase family 15 protein [Pseudomonadota bacterium]